MDESSVQKLSSRIILWGSSKNPLLKVELGTLKERLCERYSRAGAVWLEQIRDINS